MHMIRKYQLMIESCNALLFGDQFYVFLEEKIRQVLIGRYSRRLTRRNRLKLTCLPKRKRSTQQRSCCHTRSSPLMRSSTVSRLIMGQGRADASNVRAMTVFASRLRGKQPENLTVSANTPSSSSVRMTLWVAPGDSSDAAA